MVFMCKFVLCILSAIICSSFADFTFKVTNKNIKQTFQHEIDVVKKRLNDQQKTIDEVQVLKKRLDDQQRIIDEVDVLKKRLNDQQRIIEEVDVLKMQLNDQQRIIDEVGVLKKCLNHQERINDTLISIIRRNNLNCNSLSQKDKREMRGITKRAFEAGNVAFTAYLDHNIDSIGTDQVIQFNQVILNYGNAYNKFTNVFTAPVAGIYSFTFFVGQRHTNEARAYLKVNDQHIVDAAVETLHANQDSQGGNTANVMLSKGDSVYVTHVGAGTHVEGSSLRTTSFSGFLLFSEEQPSIVG